MVPISGLLQGYIMAGVEEMKFLKIKIVEGKKEIIFLTRDLRVAMSSLLNHITK
jgi:hypothetical protein